MAFDIHPLQPTESDRAYVLIRLIKPNVNLERWQSFLSQVQAEDGSNPYRGVTVAAMGGDCLVGLYIWAMQPSLEFERVLGVENFVATGTLGPEPLFSEMIKDIDRHARRLDCRAIHVSLPSVYIAPDSRQRQLLDRFMSSGFAVANHKLRKECRDARGTQSSGGAPENDVPDALH